MNVTTGGRVPLKSWAEDLEAGAAEQAEHLTDLPFAFRHVALMPDAHQGYGMPIGGVLATMGVVVPNAVGVDIGCGMRAGATDVRVNNLRPGTVDNIMRRITELVPTGFKHHATDQAGWEDLLPDLVNSQDAPVVNREYFASLRQIGTLGGGNHFIEAQADGEGALHFMLHSGSRNIGFKVAKHYNDLARELNSRWHASVPREWDLAFLPLDSDEGKLYMREMNVCLAFAKENRARMWSAIRSVLADYSIALDDGFDVHHNYAALENHYGKNVVVHCKGAVRARKGERVIIPGSMGSRSYIGTGMGNPESFSSCSHGAGRAMGRKAAKRDISAAQVLAEMEAAGIALFKPDTADVAEECQQAYKDIDDVMAAQVDLVAPTLTLRPVAVIKA